MADASPVTPKSPSRRRRSPAIAVATLLVAVAWAYGTCRLAEHVRITNVTRALVAAITGGNRPVGTSGPSPLQSLLTASLRPTRPATSHTIDPSSPFATKIAWVEGVVRWWSLAMYVIAASLGLVGFLSVATGHARALHLMAAVVILLATLGTLICTWVLMAPHLGDLPPLSAWTFVAVGVVQSAYAWFLVAVFCRPRAGQAAHA